MRKRDIPLLITGLLAMLAGIYIFLLPTIHEYQQKAQAEHTVEEFFREHPQASQILDPLQDEPSAGETIPAGTGETSKEEMAFSDLYSAMQAYNEEIFRDGQKGLADPWAYTASVLDLTEYGLENETVGVLTIPKMELQQPVFLGATKDHLNRGVAQLSISSMPIGGENTNCVLAGHRGWNGALFFRHIELLEVGDEIILTNLWETMTYRVSEIRIIRPNQAEQILIQPGRDLLTLITCHPYGSGGRYRYVVFCERIP